MDPDIMSEPLTRPKKPKAKYKKPIRVYSGSGSSSGNFIDDTNPNFLVKVLGAFAIFCISFLLFDLLSGTNPRIASLQFQDVLTQFSMLSEFHIPTDWIKGVTLAKVLDDEWAILDGLRQLLVGIGDLFRYSLQISIGLLNVFTFVAGLIGMFFTL